jgi:hypothetical protein
MVRQFELHFDPSLSLLSIADESVFCEQKEFSKTLKDEVFSKKIGQNPLLMVKPEEIPIISDILNEDNRKVGGEKPQQLKESDTKERRSKVNVSFSLSDNDDDEIAPKNYFF